MTQFHFIQLSSYISFRQKTVPYVCVCVCVCIPGWVFHFDLSCEDAHKDPDVEVDADGQQGLDVALVHPGPLVQTVEDDTESLQGGRRRDEHRCEGCLRKLGPWQVRGEEGEHPTGTGLVLEETGAWLT